MVYRQGLIYLLPANYTTISCTHHLFIVYTLWQDVSILRIWEDVNSNFEIFLILLNISKLAQRMQRSLPEQPLFHRPGEDSTSPACQSSADATGARGVADRQD
jgi:hypothetical protein